MKKIISYMFVLTALAFAASCSSDDDDTTGGTTTGLAEGDATRPTTWTAPNYALFELTMSVQVQLGDKLADYQSSQDLVCATINDEVRAVAGPQVTGDVTYFPLVIAGNGADRAIALHYYCDRLHRIFTLSNWTTFDQSTPPTGESTLYYPNFTAAN